MPASHRTGRCHQSDTPRAPTCATIARRNRRRTRRGGNGMRRACGTSFEIARWRFLIPDDRRDRSSYLRNELAQQVVAALDGKRGAPVHRSRHATTWKVKIAEDDGAHIFVKQLDTARGLTARAKAKSRAKRSAHVLAISEDLRRDGFGVPRVLLIG